MKNCYGYKTFSIVTSKAKRQQQANTAYTHTVCYTFGPLSASFIYYRWRYDVIIMSISIAYRAMPAPSIEKDKKKMILFLPPTRSLSLALTRTIEVVDIFTSSWYYLLFLSFVDSMLLLLWWLLRLCFIKCVVIFFLVFDLCVAKTNCCTIYCLKHRRYIGCISVLGTRDSGSHKRFAVTITFFILFKLCSLGRSFDFVNFWSNFRWIHVYCSHVMGYPCR